MGLFGSRPEEKTEWALPSEPVERDDIDLLPETAAGSAVIDMSPVSASASWVSFSTTSFTATEDGIREEAEDD